MDPPELRAIALVVASLFLILGDIASPDVIAAQNCWCSPDLCCSRWGYCGSTAEFCGDGCQQGPCWGQRAVNVADVVTDEFFDDIVRKAGDWCPGKSFYSRWAFLAALTSYSGFAQGGSADDSLREIAAFFGHVTHETGHFCYIEEIDGPSKDYCDRSNTQYPCVPGKGYYGRGPIQLSWNYNYGAAGESIGFDGLRSPETVAEDVVVSFKTALWFWMENVHAVMGQGFGATISAINGGECGGGDEDSVRARVGYYREYCRQLGVHPGSNLYC